MKHNFMNMQNIYIIRGKTDMRKGIDSLATLIQNFFEPDPYSDSTFLFSKCSKDHYKCLYFDGQIKVNNNPSENVIGRKIGFILLAKPVPNQIPAT